MSSRANNTPKTAPTVPAQEKKSAENTLPATDEAAVARQNKIARDEADESSMDEIWDMVQTELAGSARLSAFFGGARLLSMDAHGVTLGVPSRNMEFAENAASELATILAKITGGARMLTLQAIADVPAQPDTAAPKATEKKQMTDEELLNDPAIKRAMDLFSKRGPLDDDEVNDDPNDASL